MDGEPTAKIPMRRSIALAAVQMALTWPVSIYLIARSYYTFSNISVNSKYFKWMNCIKHILCSSGYSGIWQTNIFPNKRWLASAIKQKYIDLFLNDWYNKVGSNINYRMFKHKFEFESYLTILPSNLLHYFSSFRTRNHRLEVETGRWTGIKYDESKCNLCKAEIGDEYHYLLTCKHLDNIRKSHIKPKYFKRPNIIKYGNLINTNNI